MKRNLRQRLYQAGLFVGSVLLAYQVWVTFLALRQSPLQEAMPVMLVAAWGLILAATGLQTTAWSRIMQWLGVNLGWRMALRGYMLPFLARYVPGSVWGYLSRSEWLRHHFAVPYATSHAGSLVEVASLLNAAGVVISLYAALITGGLMRMALLGVTVSLAPLCWLGLRFARQASRLSRRWRIEAVAVTLPQWTVVVMLHTLLWLCYGGAIWLTARAFDPFFDGGLLAATFVYTTAWLAGFFFVFVPAGLGIRELTLSSMLAARLGTPVGQASVVALIARAFILLAEVAFVVVGVWANPRRPPRRRRDYSDRT